MNTEFPVDVEAGARVMGGNKDMFFKLLAKYESMGYLQNLEDLKKAYDAAIDNPNDDTYKEVKEQIHKMKGSSSYCGGS